MEDLSDEQLLRSYFRGDAQGFEMFFKRHFKKVVGYNVNRGIPLAEATEVAQNVFIKLHKNIHNYDFQRPALPWFFTIVKNSYRDWLRHKQRHQGNEILVETIYELQNLVCNSRTNDTEIEALREFLNELTKDQKNVIEFRVFEDLSFAEIAKKTGKSEVATRKIFERALASIRRRTRSSNEQD